MLLVTVETNGTGEIDVINSKSYSILLVFRSKGHFEVYRHVTRDVNSKLYAREIPSV